VAQGIAQLPSGRWQARWTDENGLRQSRGGFETKGDAAAFRRKALAGITNQPAAPPPLWRKVLRQQLGDRAEIELGEVNPYGFFVYLLWTARMDRPLYVGQSINVFARVGAHVVRPEIRPRIARVTLIRCYSEADMHKTESKLIAFYEPTLNKLGPERRSVWRTDLQPVGERQADIQPGA
jgi:hypothetical protein